MRCISPALLLLLGSLVSATPGCSADEGIGKKPSKDDKEDSGVSAISEGNTSTPGSQATDTVATSAGASTESSSSGVSDNTNSSGATEPLGTVIGVGCDEDSDCVAPTTCVRTDDSFAGALPGTGICSMPCEADADCSAVDGFSYCDYVGFASPETIADTPNGEIPEGFTTMCLQMCLYGQSDATKCGGLTTFACTPLDGVVRANATGEFQFMVGGCIPLCNSDGDCADGETCDHYWGLCLEQTAEGKAIGESCDLNATESECASRFCMGIANGLDVGVCSAACNFHPDTTVCGGEIGEDAVAGCYSNLQTPISSAIGDIAQCIPLCDADEDCPTGLACDLTEPELTVEYYGRSGFCIPTEESVAEAIENTTPDPVTEDSDAGVTDVNSTSSSGDGG